MARPASNLEGQLFGSLRAIRATELKNHNRTILWHCECTACGSAALVPSTKLKSGEVQSCGCQMYTRKVRTEKGISGFNSLYCSYARGAKSRGLVFELTKKQFKNMVIANCTYCGIEPHAVHYGSRGNAAEHGKFIYNGIDRIDSKLGYILNNCTTCCAECNLAKGIKTHEQFMSWVNRVYMFNKNFTNT